MVIRQGEVYWAEMPEPIGSEAAYRRPFVVIQNNVLNASRLRTVMVCALTSTLRHAAASGNVLLSAGEANLPLPSVVTVTQVFSFDRARLEDRIGTLSQARVREIIRGINRCLDPLEPDPE